MLKLDAKHFRGQLLRMCGDERISLYVLPKRTKISNSTIFSILAGKTPSIQRRTAYKIADEMKWKLDIEGDKAYLSKKPPSKSEHFSPTSFNDLKVGEPYRDPVQQVISKVRRLSNEQLEKLSKLIDTVFPRE